MRRFFTAAACAFLVFTADAIAAPVTGSIAFATRRGQKPVNAETIIWMDPIDGRAPRRQASNAQVATRGKALLPRIIAVPVGSSVSFPNEDPIAHNLFSLSPGNQFDLGLYRKGMGKSQKFDTPGVVNVYCNVHPNMSAVVHVMATPYYAFADRSGAFTLDVPSGRYRLSAWNEVGGSTSSVVDVGPDGRVTGSTQLTIDSRNQRVAPHLNKDGKPYRAPLAKDY